MPPAAGTALVESPLGLKIRSPAHNDSVAYVRTGCCVIQPAATSTLSSENPILYAILQKQGLSGWALGGILNNGPQREATGRKSEILKHMGTSLLMQPAMGPAKHMTGILMGAETQDNHGNPFVFVVPDVSVYDPAMSRSDSLIPVGRLIEAGFTVIHRIPSQAKEDGFPLKPVPLYAGTTTTPDGKTTIAKWANSPLSSLPLLSSQRCSKPILPPRTTSENCAATRLIGSSFLDPGNSFNMLDDIDDVDNEGYVPDYLNQDWIHFQQRYELMLKRREMAGIYHSSHGHCNNSQTDLNLQAKDIECNHLKRYILAQAHRCNACDAAPGRRHYKVEATTKAKRKTKSTLKTVAPVAKAISLAFDLQHPFRQRWKSCQFLRR